MDRALQRALFESFTTAAPSRPSHGSHVTITRTYSRPNQGTHVSRSSRAYAGGGGPASRASSSFHARAAPVLRSSGGGGRTFDSYRRDTARREIRSRRPDTNGRFNRLERDGIMPTQPGSRGSPGGKKSNSARKGRNSGRGKMPVPKRPILRSEGEIFRPLGGGWVERTIDGEWVRSGLHTQMEADTREWCVWLRFICCPMSHP